MLNTAEYDVAIIGLGPVGATLANLLAQKNLNVIIFDREATIFNLPRAIHYDGECMRVFQTVGIADELNKKIIPSPGMKFVDANNDLIINWERSTEIGRHAWCESYKFYQPDLENALREKLAIYPNVKICLRHEVFSIDDTGSIVNLRFENTAAGKLSSTTAKIVVGCDGARSTVRRFMGIELDDLQSHESWVVVDTELNEDIPELGYHSIQYCNPTRPMTYSRGPRLKRRWEIMLVKDDQRNQVTKDEWIWDKIKEWVTPETAKLERAAMYTFHSVVASKWNKGRLALAGDAAHQTPPFMGQGMAAGVKDAANLAWKLELIIKQKAPVSLLDCYTSERLPHATEFISTAVKLGEIIQKQEQLGDSSIGEDLKNFKTPSPKIGLGFSPKQLSPLSCSIAHQPILENAQKLDDVTGYNFNLLISKEFARAHEKELKKINALGIKIIIDSSESTLKYLAENNARAMLIRPDRYIYNTVNTTLELDQLHTDLVDSFHHSKFAQAN